RRAPAVPPLLRPCWRCADAFRRSLSSLPVAHKPLPGAGLARNCFSRGLPRSSPAERRGDMARLTKPPAVAPGASIAIVAPASAAQPDRIERGLAALEALGFTPRLASNALLRAPLYFAGTAAGRLAYLHAAFSDPATGAVMALRGGYGAN